ncbi:MAG TPA: VCBS domain-containing protein, partial [Telluria sp.]|nr:VCBS domain-containing protein [Telluria sp.]
MATSGPQVLNGTTSNDNLIGGSGNDTLNGGAGSDTVNGDSGNDTLIYDVPQGTTQSKDLYTGGSGIDTLMLRFTLQQWLDPVNQTQVANYLAHQNLVTNRHTLEISNSTNSDFVFTFGTSTLTVQMTELLRVFVDGVELNPADELVTATNDAATTGEESAAIGINVLANDVVPDLVKSIAVTTPPAHGTATLVKPNALVPASWYFSYQPNSSYYQYLSSGQTATDTFSYIVTDADGDTSTATVTMTITGSNDSVSITSATQVGAVVEDTTGNASGTITFNDIDLNDSHTASVSSSNSTTLGTFSLATVNEAAGAANGSVGWSYALNHAAAQYLAAGETEEEVFTVELNDGNGSTTTQNVTVTITGTNDNVIVTSAAQEGSVTEDTAPGSATGTIQFTDADLTDEHETSVSSSNATTLGAFVLGAVSESATTTGGSVGWTYTLDNGAAQYLAAGETEEEVFTVELDDGNGSTTTQNVTVTITGTNDDVIVTSAAQTGSVTEDIAPGSATGTIQFTDADLTDEHETNVTSSNATTLGAFVLGTVSESATTTGGSVGWTYTLDNGAAQYLAA